MKSLPADTLYSVPLSPFDERVLSCSLGNHPWDDWERAALEKGVPSELAALGRAVFREAYQHDWDEHLKSLCGWRDDGCRMLKLVLRSPRRAGKRWQRLLETDGDRGEYNAQTGEWVPHY